MIGSINNHESVISTHVRHNAKVLWMKKLLVILVLSLLFSVNVYAATEKIYLVCEVRATDTSKNTGKMMGLIPYGSKVINVNYISIEKKNKKIKIVIYEHYAGVAWSKTKPEKLLSILPKSDKVEKSDYVDGHYLYSISDNFADGEAAKMTFDIYMKDDKWIIQGSDYMDGGEQLGIKDYLFEGNCIEFVKKNFLKIRKKGIVNYKS